VLDVEDDEGSSDDLPDPPRVEADVSQRFEGRLEQRVSALADRAQAVVRLVELLMDEQHPTVFAAGPRVGGPGRPAIGHAGDLDVATMIVVFSRPPQVNAPQ